MILDLVLNGLVEEDLFVKKDIGDISVLFARPPHSNSMVNQCAREYRHTRQYRATLTEIKLIMVI